MSKTIDERVVSMQFDNAQFERNVQTSLSTIDKLKQSLNFKGASKGLDEIGASAKKCDMSSLGSAVDTVKVKFSALEVMGVTALANITNSAVNAGKRIASAFTIEPIKSGFQEYETQINAVQTILANTQHEGTNIDQVNAALDELNHYADMTIYNFTEMTRNIGTFTAAGVDLQTSVDSIKGIANLAAVSGSTSQQASTAMYQLSQALAAGKVSLQDWNSVVNAGMGGKVFQDALVRTSELLKTGAKQSIATYGSFRESLTKGEWLTTEVLTETLKQFAGAYDKADLIQQGFTESQAEEIMQMANTAEEAATKVKTFTQLMDTLKEAAQSGWTQTWEILIGDFEEAKELFTELSDYFGDIINKSAESRNNMLEGAMNSKWNQLGDKIEDVGLKTKDLSADMFDLSAEQLKNKGFTEQQIKVIQTLKEQCDKTGMSVDEMIENMNRPSGRELLIDSFRNIIYSIVDAIKAVKKAWTDIFPPMTSGQLYTAIEAFHSLTEHLKMNDETADKITRTFKGLFSILKIFTTLIGGGLSLAVKAVSAVLSVFNLDILDVTASIGDALVKVKEIIVDNNLLVKGIKIVATAVKEFVQAFLKIPAVQKTITSIKESFAEFKDIVTGNLSEAVSKFVNAFKDLDKLTLDDLKKILDNLREAIKNCFDNSKDSLKNMRASLGDFKDAAVEQLGIAGEKFQWIKEKVMDFVEWVREKLPAAIAIGMGVATIMAVKKLASALEVLGKPLELLENLVEGVTGVFKSFSDAIERNAKAKAFKTRAEGIKELAIAIGILAASVYALSKIDSGDLWRSVAAITALTTVLSAATIAISKLSGPGLGSAKGSSSILMLSASMLILVKALEGIQELDSSKFLVNISAMIAMMAGLGTVAGLLGKFAPSLSTGSLTLIALATSIKIMVSALKTLDETEFENVGESLVLLLGMVGTMALLAKACSKISFTSGVGMIAAIVSLKLLVSTFKSLENVDLSKAGENLFSFIAIFGTFALVMKASQSAGQYAVQAGVGILAMSAALLLITVTIKQLGNINKTDLQKATDAVSGLLVVFGAVVALSHFAGANAAKAGVMLLAMSGALLLLTGAIAILKNMSPEGLDQALAVITYISAIFAGLIAVTKIAGPDVSKNLITMTVAIGVFAALVAALTLIDQSKVQSATACLSAIMGMFALLIAATSLINTAKGAFLKSLGTITVLVGVATVLAGLLVILSSLEVQNTLEVAASLSILLLSLAASCAVLSMANGVLPTALIAVGVMTAVVAGLAVILGTLCNFTNGDEAIKVAASLSILLVSMTAVCAALTLIGAAAPAALIGAGALVGVITIIGGFMTIVGTVFSKFEGLEAKLDAGISILTKIGEGIGSFFGSIISGFGDAATSNLEEIGTRLGNFMTNAMPFFDNVSSLTADKLTGVQTLASIVGALSGMNIKEQLASWISGEDSIIVFTDQISKLGDGLAAFSSKVTADGVNLTAIDTAATASKKLVDIAANITPFTTDMATFKTDLIAFGDAIVAFSTKVTGGEGGAAVNSEAVEAAANAGKLLTEVASAIPKQGMLQDVMGKQDLADFGAKVEAFGESIINFSEKVSGLDENAAGNIRRSTDAGKALTEVANAIPKQGLLQEIMGKQDIADFGAKIVAFGTAVKAYAAQVTGLDETAAENISRSAKAGMALTEVANAVPKQDGVMQALMGQQEIASFGASLTTFGKGITSYAAEAAKITDEDIEAIKRSKDAITEIVNVADAIPKEGGIGALFGGDENVGGFATGVLTLASAIKNYVSVANSITEDDIDAIKNSKDAVKELGKVSESAASDFGEIDIAPVNTAISVMRSLVSFATGLADRDYSGVTSFKTAIEDLGNISLDKIVSAFDSSKLDSIKTFATTLGQIGADAVNNFANAITNNSASVQQAGMTLVGKLRDGISASKGTATGAINTVLSSMSVAIQSKGGTMETAGRTLMSKLVSGLSKASNSIKTTIGTVLASAVTKIEGYYSNFYDAGGYIIEGLADGIDGSSCIAADAARAAAREALDAAKEALGMNSPSKEFIEVGKYSCLGLKVGLESYAPSVYESGVFVGQQLSQGVRDRLGINSPAKDGQESGKYEGEGLVQGLKSKATDIYNSGKEAAGNVAKGISSFGAKAAAYDAGENTAQGFLDGLSSITTSSGGSSSSSSSNKKKSSSGTSKVAKAGSTMVKTVAAGITSDKSAEEAAENKADEILKVFSEKLEALNLKLETTNLEYELWQNTDGLKASDSETSAKELENLTDQLDVQSERVKVATEEYEATMKLYGETATETQQAYNDLLEEKIKSSKLVAQIAEANATQMKSEKAEFDEYSAWYKQNFNSLANSGASGSDIKKAYESSTSAEAKAAASRLAYKMSHSAETTGSNTGTGLAKGLSSAVKTVASAAKTVASAVSSTMKSTLKTHSPSKETFAIGQYASEGLANGLSDYANNVYNSATNVGKQAITGLREAISKVKDTVESDIDTQPTIRPVLDLSDITSGANAMSNMLNINPSASMMSDLGSINSMMNARNQNGVNGDVVSAIEDLGRRFSGYSGDTYTINGVTYDDGSNISEAVKTLVRAARVERRR